MKGKEEQKEEGIMPRMITELKTVQRPVLKYAEKAGWEIISPEEALSLRGDASGKLFYSALKKSLLRLNSDFLNEQNVDDVIRKIENVPDTMEGNRKILSWLRGYETIFDPKDNRNRHVCLIDFQNPENNDFFVTEEWPYSNPHKTNRADLMFLINGIPLAVAENKNPKNKNAMEEAISQLQRMERETPEILSCPQVFNITDALQYFYGVTWNYTRKNIFNWKKESQGQNAKPAHLNREKEAEGKNAKPNHFSLKAEAEGERSKQISLEEAVLTFFEKSHFLKMIKNWVLFYMKENEWQKTILRQHQTRAVEKAIKRCQEPSKKRGLIWHTQGSGKTFTMISLARLILEADKSATALIIVDRNELEGQLELWINRIVGELKNSGILIQRAESKKDLQKILKSDFRGLIISTIHKFNEIEANSCLRENFYIFIDEAHRSIEGDLGNYLTGALPQATIIGFTGTPVDKSEKGRGTFKVFGRDDKKGYLDKYSIAESIEDGTTVKLRYSLAPNHLAVDGEKLEKEFFSLAETEGISDIETLNKILNRAVRLKAFLKSPDRVDKIAKFVSKHFKENVQPLGYKAFLSAVDREACALYKKALDKYLPKELSSAVYTKNLNDPELLKKYQLSEDEEKAVRKNFVKTSAEPQILIVTDKLLTGYDAPILYCMYLDKPMRDHVLLQAIARVNRPYENEKGQKKPCGLIVDFVGMFRSMKKALSFDSHEIKAVVEDLDALRDQFKKLITKDMLPYLFVAVKGHDKLLEKLLYETFLDPGERKKFIALFEDMQNLYEILSPDPKLRPYLEDYRKMAELYQAVKRCYRDRAFFISEICKKTEKLVQSQTTVNRFSGILKVYEIGAETLKELQRDSSEISDNNKVISLIRSLQQEAQTKSKEEPYLISISEKAQKLMEAWTEGQKNSKEVLEQALNLMKEVVEAREQKKKSPLSSQEFALCWALQKRQIKTAELLASQISKSFDKFINFQNSLDEQRLLKTDIYQILSNIVPIDGLPELADELIALVKEMRK